MKTIELTKEFFETCGANSIEGRLVDEGATEPQPIKLRMKQTSFAWRQEHGGPDIYMIPEFAPLCLMDSVLRLTARGYKIELEWYT